jgi:hypothetical protein
MAKTEIPGLVTIGLPEGGYIDPRKKVIEEYLAAEKERDQFEEELRRRKMANGKAVKEVKVMDLDQKQRLVRSWFENFSQQNGFDVTVVGMLELSHSMLLRVGKSNFPGIQEEVTVTNQRLMNTSPRQLLNEVLPRIGEDLANGYQQSLRQARIKGGV